jgi:hypothetical protein
LKISNSNELDYSELIISIDVRDISGKVAFNMVKGCYKDYTESHEEMACERLNNNMSQLQTLIL